MARGQFLIILVTDAFARYRASRNLELDVRLKAKAYPRTRVSSPPAMAQLRPVKVLCTGQEFGYGAGICCETENKARKIST